MKGLIVTCLLAAFAIPSSVQPADRDEAFVHTVFFWLKNPDSDADRRQLYEGLEMLAEIPLMEKAYVGVPAPTDRSVIDRSYDFSLTFVFPDQAAQDAYQEHPEHLQFIEDYGHLWQRVLVYDAVDPAW